MAARLVGAERLLTDAFGTGAGLPSQVAGYRVVRLLGEGAFGTVLLCEQQQPVARMVAVKILRAGVTDPHSLRRFMAERQVLAELAHPAIPPVFDAGVLPDGRPYFVMEFIDGLPLARYCDQRDLALEARLRLFVEVCRGVAHAHGRRVVHRDLKPANVLVVDTEAGPRPKLIDFGIAKALMRSGSDMGPRTDAGRVIGTPGYMSPEQAAGHSDAVDARADVWALGVMLYELLCGVLPWSSGAKATDTGPVRPSARVRSLHGTSTAAGETIATRRAARLRGDLDWITLKALALEPRQRYPSAADLADDLERHLRGAPVSAGPPSFRYRMRKFVRRNRAMVLVVAAAIMVVGAGLGLAWTWVRDARNTLVATYAGFSAAVQNLMMRANDPQLREAPQGDAARQALLQEAARLADRLLLDHPADHELRLSRCRALVALASVHLLLGEPARASVAARTAAAAAEELLAVASPDLALQALLGDAVRRYGNALALAGEPVAARQQLTRAAEILAACAKSAPEVYGLSHAVVLRESALALPPQPSAPRIDGLRASLAVLDILRGDAPPSGWAEAYVTTCCCLGQELFVAEKMHEADEILASAECELPRVSEDRQRSIYQVNNQRARVMWEIGERQGAMARMRAAVEAASAWKMEQPQRQLANTSLVVARRDLGYGLNYLGEYAESEAVYREAIAQAEAVVVRFAESPIRSKFLIDVLCEFALVLSDRFLRGSLAEAEACLVRALELDAALQPAVVGQSKPRWELLAMLAVVEDARGETAAPSSWGRVERELAAMPVVVGPRPSDALIGAMIGIARWHYEARRVGDAEAWLVRVEAFLHEHPEGFGKRVVEAAKLEARLAAARGDAAGAAAAADRALAARPTWFGKRHAADCLQLAVGCGASSAAPAYRERAAQLYAAVVAELGPEVAKEPGDPWVVLPWGFASLRLAGLAAAAGDAGQARELLAAALPALERVREVAHADQWDESAVRDGWALQALLISGK